MVAARIHPHRLAWLCRACGRPIEDGTGYLHVDHLLVSQRESAREDWERKGRDDFGLSFADFIRDVPDEVPWEAHHAACDPDPDSGDYWIEIHRVRTHGHLLNWTAHLMEKSWLMDTNWDELIRHMSGVDA